MSQLSEQYSGRQEPRRSKKPTKHKKEPVKITYISSPTMVKATSASEFRAIVQELTGKDSKVEDPFDAYSVISNEEASQVPHYGNHLGGGPVVRAWDQEFNVAGVHDVFPNNTPFLQTEDGFFWGDVSEMSFEFRSPCVFDTNDTVWRHCSSSLHFHVEAADPNRDHVFCHDYHDPVRGDEIQQKRTQAEESHRDRCYCPRRFQNQEKKQRKAEGRNEALPNQCINHPQLRLRCQAHQTRSLAWTSDRAGLAGSSPVYMG
ncbi:hypothetical protein NC651_030006 [Populus alba x Populus x berolinensis]|nr:hypothetical protein NC651_030006 [Populus alba x Populus x berolinensis]